jgi:protein-S-isoprenylcysteine O-methyltransferase Ste14
VINVALISVNAAGASLLFVSGAAKIVSPGQLARSVNDLFGPAGRRIGPVQVRAFAGCELLAAFLLLTAATRLAGAWSVGALGAGFAAAGAMGRLRGSRTACGCFGAASARPLGLANVLAGALLMAVPVVNQATTTGADSRDYFLTACTASAAAALALCLWVHRALVRDLTRPLPAVPQPPPTARQSTSFA